MSNGRNAPGQLQTEQRAPHLSARKRRAFLAVVFLFPVLFLVLLEGGLRVFGYGTAYHQWMESADGQSLKAGGRYLMLNPDIAAKYFHTTTDVPFSNEEAFEKSKRPNAFRVFVLGGSSAAGYPFEPNGSFSRYIQHRLSLLYPRSRIEVVNCAMSAVCSYTLRDLLPGVLEEKPDLILLYAGHNEYYGALGVGSTESFGSSRLVVNLVVSLERFRLVQLLRDAIRGASRIFTGSRNSRPETLMARMVRDQYIGFGSDLYENGVAQFEGNLADILDMTAKAHVPVIIGTLTCNLKDQPPFVSLPASDFPPADQVYREAVQALRNRELEQADSLFRWAKDLDALKFRAPSEFNSVIRRLAVRYGAHVVDIDSAFRAISPDRIAGNNLFVDHLHPTLAGYQDMGELFFDEMRACRLLPGSEPVPLADRTQDSLARASLRVTPLDSVMAAYKMAVLKDNWPFAEAGKPFSYSSAIHPRDGIDSLAAGWLEHTISWKNAHLTALAGYLARNDVRRAVQELDALVDQYPYNDQYYQFAVTTLLPLHEYRQAFRYLKTSYALAPTAFNAKWLGALSFDKGEIDTARQYLEQSLFFDSDDAQTWYQLALTYVNRDNSRALRLVERALTGDPHFREALALRSLLTSSQKANGKQ